MINGLDNFLEWQANRTSNFNDEDEEEDYSVGTTTKIEEE